MPAPLPPGAIPGVTPAPAPTPTPTPAPAPAAPAPPAATAPAPTSPATTAAPAPVTTAPAPVTTTPDPAAPDPTPAVPIERRFRILAPCHHQDLEVGQVHPLSAFTSKADFKTDGAGTWEEKKEAAEKAIIDRLVSLGVISEE
jgi:hypothetical protein